MIYLFSSSKLARRAAALGALFMGASLGSALAAPAQAKPKTAVKKAKPNKGLMLEGSGVCTLQATIAGGSSGVSNAAFASIGRTKGFGKRIVSSSTAQKSNGYSVVVNFIGGRRDGDVGPPRSERDVDRNRPESDRAREQRLSAPSTRIMLTFSSPTGFYAGQTIPIAIPVGRPKPPAQSFMDFADVVRVEGREVIDGNGNRRRSGRNRGRSWIAASGTFRVQSVTPDRITFSLQNVRFVVPKIGREQNAATGSFVMQGTGQCTLNEVD